MAHTFTVRYSAMEPRMKPISSSLGCGRIVISALLSVAHDAAASVGGLLTKQSSAKELRTCALQV